MEAGSPVTETNSASRCGPVQIGSSVRPLVRPSPTCAPPNHICMYDCKLPNDSVVCRHKHRRREGLGLGERSTEEPGLGAILVWKPPGTQVVHYPFFAIALRVLFLPRCLLAGYKCADVDIVQDHNCSRCTSIIPIDDNENLFCSPLPNIK